MTRVVVAAEIGYLDVTVSPATSSTLYMASEAFVTDHTDTLADTFFAGRMDGDVSYKLILSTAFWGGQSSIGIGSIEIINDDGDLDEWLQWEFRDQAIVLKQHTIGSSYNSAQVLLNAIIERLDVVDEKRLRIVIRDPAAPMVVPMLTDSYDDTTDADGVLIPVPFGQPELCAPILVDETTLEYHVSDITILGIDAVYDQGVEVDYNPVDKGFRLISNPTGKVTCTPVTSGTGEDPTLTLSETEYLVSGSGRSLQCFNDGLSPEVSLDYATSDADHSRVSTSGGKYYFEMYIDSLNEPTSTLSPRSWGGAAFDVAIGISSATISNPQTPKATGFYCLSVGAQFAAAAIGTEYNAYNNNVLSDSHDVIPRNSVGDTIGVKVDFDALTIEYLRNNVNDDAVFGTWSIAAGTYFPVLTSSDKQKDAIATIRLTPDDFVYALPSGYTAWSPGLTADTDFTKFTQSITSRITGVTFDSTSVAAIAALAHSSPEVIYTYSYYLDKPTTASQLLTWAMTSIGGYWFINRLGEVEVGQLTLPGTSIRTIDDVSIIDDISITSDYAKALSNGIGALKNWSPYRDSEVSGSATETWKQQITRDYQFEYRSANPLSSGYTHADGAEMPINLLSDSVAAETEADRLTALYATERKFFRVPIAMNAIDFDNAIDEIGSTYTLQSDRWGLDDGVDFVLVGVDGSFLENKLTLTLWGNTDVAPPPEPYLPGMIDFATGRYFWADVGGGFSGNKMTGIVWFNRSSWTAGGGATIETIHAAEADGGKQRYQFDLYASDHAVVANRNKLVVSTRSSAGPTICQLISIEDAADGQNHIAMYSFDGDNGLAKFTMDSLDADDTSNAGRIAPTTGTLATGGGGQWGVGKGFTANLFLGKAGFVGGKNGYLTNHLDFMEGNNPKKLDEAGWTEWGGIPLVFTRSGNADYHAGNGPDVTISGTPAFIVGDSYDFPKMTYDGINDRFRQVGYSNTGQSQTLMLLFSDSEVNASNNQHLVTQYDTVTFRFRLVVRIPANSNNLEVRGQDASGTVLFRSISTTNVTDGGEYFLQLEYDGAAGTLMFRLNGEEVDDVTWGSRVAPIAGTLVDTNAFNLGDNTGANLWYKGKMGYIAYDPSAGHDPDDYYNQSTGDPIYRDLSSWDCWQVYGELDSNDGTDANWIKDGPTGPSNP